MNEPRCIAQLLRNESPRAIDFTITHGKGRKGIIIRTKKQFTLLCGLFFRLEDLNLGRFRRLENVPAAHFQPDARGRYRARSVAVPKRKVCKRSDADGQVLLSAPKSSSHFCVGCFFVKTALHLFVIFFTIFRFYYCKMDFNGL